MKIIKFIFSINVPCFHNKISTFDIFSWLLLFLILEMYLYYFLRILAFLFNIIK